MKSTVENIESTESGAVANLAMRAVFAICAFILAMALLPAGTAHAASYSIPSNAQDSGTSGGCTWYITSASASSNPGQLVIYPTNGSSGTLAGIREDSSPWNHSTAIQSIYVASGVKTNSNFNWVFRECTSLVSADITNLNTSAATDISGLFYGCTALKSIDGIGGLNVAKVTTMESMFANCEALGSLNLSKWNCAALTSVYEAFERCYALKTLVLPSSMPKLTNAAYAFNSCQALTSLDVSCFENGVLADVYRCFQGCYELKNLTGYEEMVTANVTSLDGVFSNCRSLTSLDVSKWKTSNVTTFSSLFGSCRSIESIKGLNAIDTSKGKNFSYMFSNCWELSSVTFGTNFKTSAGTNFSYMFSGDESLKVLDISMFDTTSATNLKKMFNEMNVLQQVKLGAKFSFTGNGTATECVLPTPDPAYIPGATGNWQAVADGTVSAPAGKVYAPANVPSKVAETYVMEKAKTPILAAERTWYKSAADRSAYTAINIVDSYAPTGSEKESWDASAAQDGSVMAYVSADGKTLTIAGNGSGYVKANANSMVAFDAFASVTAINGLALLDTSDVLSMFGFFADNPSLTSVEGIEDWDVSSCTTFASMFSECTSLTSVDLSRWDMASAENIGDFFFNCRNLVDLKTPTKTAGNLVGIYHAFESCVKLESVDVSFMCSGKIELASCVFQSCESLKTITGYETLVTASTDNISAIFNCCEDLEYLDLSQWVTDNVTTLNLSFGTMYNIEAIDGLENWNVSNVESMRSTFRSCWVPDLSGVCGWDVSNVETFNSTFEGAVELTSLDLSSWSTDAAENMGSMFDSCIKLTTLKLGPGFTTENVTDFSMFLIDCHALKVVDLSMLDTSAASDMTDFFTEMWCLQQVTLGESFSFTGDGTTSCVLPTPDPVYIPGATGNWQAVAGGTVSAPVGTIYLPADVPSNVAETYVMPLTTLSVDVPVKVVLAANAEGEWCTPTAAGNRIINHSLLPVRVVSAKAQAVEGFTMLTGAQLAASDASNVFAGTVTAGAGAAQDTAQDLTSIDTSGDAWTMAAETADDDSDLISLQLAGSVANVEGTYFTDGTKLFDVAYAFELVL